MMTKPVKLLLPMNNYRCACRESYDFYQTACCFLEVFDNRRLERGQQLSRPQRRQWQEQQFCIDTITKFKIQFSFRFFRNVKQKNGRKQWQSARKIIRIKRKLGIGFRILSKKYYYVHVKSVNIFQVILRNARKWRIPIRQ